MARPLASLFVALVLMVSLLWPEGSLASPNTTAAAAALAGTHIKSVYVRAPRGASVKAPLQVLVALHGMGGNGEAFARDLVDQADQYGWMLVAPTIEYGNWTDPAQVATEDPTLINALVNYVDQLPQITGFPVRRQLLLLGHSRGAQLAHRFAEFRPDKVLAVAALSAGTYTLPQNTLPQPAGAAGPNLSFPFGVKDIDKYGGKAFDAGSFDDVQILVGVGGDDNNPADVPRQWDSLEGTDRVQRAEAFEKAAKQLGAGAVLKIFGGTKHEFTPEMRTAACSFLAKAMVSVGIHGGPLAATPLAF
jgi:pimeloyl-ACP methyl ester carboxylesterase